MELPPKAFCNIRVRAESRYGGNIFFLIPKALSAKQFITFPKINKDLLILHPSFNLSPVEPVIPVRSEPAKSTKFILLNFSLLFLSNIVICLNSIVTIVCARELVAFINVEPIVLF